MISKKSIQFNFSYLHWSTVWCCQKIEELKIENLWTKNSLFPSHTQTNLKYISWNGKNTVQSTSKMIFNFLNSYFDKKLYGLMLILGLLIYWANKPSYLEYCIILIYNLMILFLTIISMGLLEDIILVLTSNL